MQIGSLKTLAVVVSLFFFTSNLSGMFLPVYFKDLGLGVAEIVEILFFTFLVIGLLPLILLNLAKNFERIISLGIFFTMLFYVALIYIRSPILLGLAYGLGLATFWPSFNLLQFRLSESRVRARTVSLFSSIIPSLAGIVGPAVGGFIIERFSFTNLFITAVVLYFVAFILSSRIRFQTEIHEFSVPKSKKFVLFLLSFVILGFIEAYWLAYPLFVISVSGTVFDMGLVLASSAVLLSVVTFLVNWLSDVKGARVSFAIIGAALNASWYFVIGYASTLYEIVALSLLSSLAGAFTLSWLAHYGDSFKRDYYASILVMMEFGFMIGRMMNLVPTYAIISHANYASYFILLGLASLLLVPVYFASEKW
jgi:hypothetical protein